MTFVAPERKDQLGVSLVTVISHMCNSSQSAEDGSWI